MKAGTHYSAGYPRREYGKYTFFSRPTPSPFLLIWQSVLSLHLQSIIVIRATDILLPAKLTEGNGFSAFDRSLRVIFPKTEFWRFRLFKVLSIGDVVGKYLLPNQQCKTEGLRPTACTEQNEKYHYHLIQTDLPLWLSPSEEAGACWQCCGRSWQHWNTHHK